MRFVDYEFFESLYSGIDQITFNRLVWDAEKIVRDYTTGIDGRSKLDFAFPTNECDAEAVRRCVCALVDTMAKVEKANNDAEGGKVVSSVSAGNESISYNVNGGLVGSLISDKKAQNDFYKSTVEEYLRGLKDKNGVNLLFRGAYPYINIL